MLVQKLQKLQNKKIEEDYRIRREQEEVKRKAEEEQKRVFEERRKALVPEYIEDLIVALESAASQGKDELSYIEDHELSPYGDPLHVALQSFAKDNELYYELKSVPVYDEDYEGRTTSRIMYFNKYPYFSWKKKVE